MLYIWPVKHFASETTLMVGLLGTVFHNACTHQDTVPLGFLGRANQSILLINTINCMSGGGGDWECLLMAIEQGFVTVAKTSIA